jgi:hypothetical protein
MGVQTTVAGSMNKRILKIAAEPRSKKFLAAGGQIIVHGWKKRTRNDPPGKEKWFCKQERVV